MGWMKVRGTKMVWGDTPQDIVSKFTEDTLGKDEAWWLLNLPDDSDREQREAMQKLKSRVTRTLRVEVDKEYRKQFGRNATKQELNNLLGISIGLKGARTH